ncbi:MAG TPA: spermidine synthase, partial [Blastocatellia bacterium]|nr:spermidine synthase [Blastocatellia bacterium]
MVWLFAITLFVSALLLFLVQPLIARMLLPLLGGTPAVWQTCLFFFQGALLAGYGYAHFTGKWFAPRRQALLHLAVLAVAALSFPLVVSETLLPAINKQTSPMLWLLGCLTVTVGLPFFAVSTSGPLLQWWFAQTRHVLSANPYFLYAAGNLGSLAALLGYPLLVEPNLRLSVQARFWSIGYGLLALLIAACALTLWKNTDDKQAQTSVETDGKAVPITLTRRLHWIALAFAPTSLMYGVTTYLTTDIAAVPLLWVLPLALYLLSFILVFARRRVVSLPLLNALMPLPAVVLTFLMLTKLPRPLWLLGTLHLLFMFVAATVCHGRLADDRPAARHLTEFYLWMSVAGALGGLFNSLLAPLLFRTVIEYPLAIVLALLLRPGKADRLKPVPLLAWPFGVGLLTAGLAIVLPRVGLPTMAAVVVTLVLPLLLSYGWARRPLRFGLAIGAVMLGSFFFQDLFYGRTLHVERNFFGVLRVAQDQTNTFHQIFHGNTNHG